MIVSGLAHSFKLDVIERMAQDVFRMALYLADASLNNLIPLYTTVGEVQAPGYTAGGIVLTGYKAVMDGPMAMISWADPVWSKSSITARGALIYNYSRGNRAVAVVDLGPSPSGDSRGYTSSNGDFVVTLPELTTKTALIRIL